MKTTIVITFEGNNVNVTAPIDERDLCLLMLTKALEGIITASSPSGLLLAQQMPKTPIKAKAN